MAAPLKAYNQISSDLRSTLHLAIPALEKLHAEWTSKGPKEKYFPFHEAIEAALSKVEEYYQKTGNSNSYILAMVLYLQRKRAYFEKHWPKSLQASAKKALEKMAWARAQGFRPRTQGSGSGLENLKPKPPQAEPEPGHSGRAGPSTSLTGSLGLVSSPLDLS
ncbi:hypothetical protein C8J57DRAFT_1532482 [Mycena rebaudengoi]|nr:hypothetical protein C8J57DRAFT_1532482 [Mycena rebaudengoi]